MVVLSLIHVPDRRASTASCGASATDYACKHHQRPRPLADQQTAGRSRLGAAPPPAGSPPTRSGGTQRRPRGEGHRRARRAGVRSQARSSRSAAGRGAPRARACRAASSSDGRHGFVRLSRPPRPAATREPRDRRGARRVARGSRRRRARIGDLVRAGGEERVREPDPLTVELDDSRVERRGRALRIGRRQTAASTTFVVGCACAAAASRYSRLAAVSARSRPWTSS